MIAELKQARLMIESSWSGPDIEPFCVVRAPGVRLNLERVNRTELFAPLWLPTPTFQTLNPHHPLVESYSVLGALEVVGVAYDGFDLLDAACRPPAGLSNWLRASERVTSHVLDLFIEAIKRCKKGERRG